MRQTPTKSSSTDATSNRSVVSANYLEYQTKWSEAVLTIRGLRKEVEHWKARALASEVTEGDVTLDEWKKRAILAEAHLADLRGEG
jgi:hypothetical protein